MKRVIAWVLVLGVLSPIAAEASAYGLLGSVLANGGTPASGGTFQLAGTAGQAIVGTSSGPSWMVSHGYWRRGVPITVSVDPPLISGDLPGELELGPATPNPSRGSVGFTLALPQACRVQVVVFDLQGREVSRLIEERLEPGRYLLAWDQGARTGAQSGMYFARLLVDGRPRHERRFVIVR